MSDLHLVFRTFSSLTYYHTTDDNLLDALAGFHGRRVLPLIWRESRVAEEIIVISVGRSAVCLVCYVIGGI